MPIADFTDITIGKNQSPFLSISVQNKAQSDINQDWRAEADQRRQHKCYANDHGIDAAPVGKASAYAKDFLVSAVQSQFGHKFLLLFIKWTDVEFGAFSGAHDYATNPEAEETAGATLKPMVTTAQKIAANIEARRD